MNNIGRRKFIQLSVVAATGGLLAGHRSVYAADLPQLSEDDPMAVSMKYTHDASTVDPASRPNPAEVQNCANCALVQGDDGATWRQSSQCRWLVLRLGTQRLTKSAPSLGAA